MNRACKRRSSRPGVSMDPSCRLKNAGHGDDELFPAGRLRGELTPASRCETVEPRTPVVLGGPPFRVDPSAFLEPPERGVQRTLVHLQDVPRDLLDVLGDPPAVHLLLSEHAQDE